MSELRISTDETLQFPSRIGEAVEVYRDPYTVIRRQVAEFDGFSKDYFMWDRGVRAALVVLWKGKVLMTRQYRFLVNRITTELPGGKVEDGEDPAVAAIRECAEETGVRCSSVEKLIFYHPGLDTYHNPTTIFISENPLEPVADSGDSFVWVDQVVAVQQVFNGEVCDSLSIIGLLALQHRMTSR